jgi:ABC-2 type transport system ATP-binding protein
MYLIELEHVSHWFGRQQALDDVSLRLGPGRIGLLGPNGAGKSTLFKVLLGLVQPTCGTGQVLGQPLISQGGRGGSPWRRLHAGWRRWWTGAAAQAPWVRRSLGYMPEAAGLVAGLRGVEYVALAGELCGLPPKQARRRAHEVLTYVGLDEARYRPLEDYSTGMKQRLKLAQALVHDPPVLLLDEPTSGLDPAGREGMLRLLHDLGQTHGKTFLLSTHLLTDVAAVCDTVVILHRGRLLAQGSVADLCRRRQDHYRLRLEGPSAAFCTELRLEGAEVLQDNGKGELRVRVPAGWTSRAFFLLAAHTGVILRGLSRDDEDLEELFHRVLAEAEGQRFGASGSTPPPSSAGLPASAPPPHQAEPHGT